VANHEFEKARFYREEELKQRDALALLQQKHNLPDKHVVTREHIEEALARWTGMRVAAIRQAVSSPEVQTQKPGRQKAREKTKEEIFLATR
jgi:ATP-dependent Clp protease ATP-binding subunit ClpC